MAHIYLSKRFKAHFRVSLWIALNLRLKYIIGLIINLGIGLIFPLLMSFTIRSTSPKENLSLSEIYLDSPCLKDGTCYTFAWGPTGNPDVEEFMMRVFKESAEVTSRKEVRDIGFQTLEELHNFLKTDGLGHVGVGLFIENTTRAIRLYCNGKIPNLALMSDISLPDSTLLQTIRVLNKVSDGISGYNIEFYNTLSLFFQSVGATSISIVSMTFIVSGMYTLSNIGIMKSCRRYEYLVCHGFHRLAYQAANILVTLGEIGLMLIGTILICYYCNIGSVSNPWLTIVVLLLSIFPVSAQNISWSLFCAATIKKPNTMQLLFFLPSMLVAIVQMMITFSIRQRIGDTSSGGIQFLMAFLSVLFPPFASSAYFTAASALFSRDGLMYSTFGKTMSIGAGLTTSTRYYPNVLLLALLSIVSGTVYLVLAAYSEYTSAGSLVPQKPFSFFFHWLRTLKNGTGEEAAVPLVASDTNSTGAADEHIQYSISLSDVSVVFPFTGRASKNENPRTGDVIKATYVDNGTMYTTVHGYAVREKDTKALNHLTLNLPYNHVIGLLGANGSGKSTLLKVLTGLQKPTSQRYLPNKYAETENGRVRLLTQYNPTVAEEKLYSGRHMALVFQENVLLPKFRVSEQINVLAAVTLFDFDAAERSRLIAYSLECMGLSSVVNQRVETLSGGQMRRLNIAMAILLCEANLAEILIMDEPACGVDVESRTFLWQYLKRLQLQAHQSERRFCVLLTTHLFEEVEELCDTVVILRDGKLLAAGSQLFFKTQFSGDYQLIVDWPESKEKLEAIHARYFVAQTAFEAKSDTSVGEQQSKVKTNPCQPNLSTLLISYAHQDKISNALEDLAADGVPQEKCSLHTALLSEIFIRQQEQEMPERPAVEYNWYASE